MCVFWCGWGPCSNEKSRTTVLLMSQVRWATNFMLGPWHSPAGLSPQSVFIGCNSLLCYPTQSVPLAAGKSHSVQRWRPVQVSLQPRLFWARTSRGGVQASQMWVFRSRTQMWPHKSSIVNAVGQSPALCIKTRLSNIKWLRDYTKLWQSR
jgi:hypothetical protein